MPEMDYREIDALHQHVRDRLAARRRNRMIFSGAAAAVVAAVAITVSLAAGSGNPPPVPVANVPGIHVGDRIDGAVQLVSDDNPTPARAGSVGPVVHAQQLLAIKLLRDLGSARRNVSVSPESLQLALGMLQNGARGTTRAQIAKALQSPGLTTEQQNGGLADLTRELSAAARGHLQLDTANSLWQQQGVRLRPQFLAAIAPYGAGVWQTDFQTSQGLDAVNRWTDANTHGTIPKLFDELQPSTVLVLANALYLHANWQTPFLRGETTTGPFTTGGGRRVSAHFMTGVDVSGVSTPAYDAARLPYRGGRFAADVIMPTHGSLAAFAGGLTPARLAVIATSLDSATAGIELPRFTTATSTNLAPTLERLGMRQAFGPAADLSGLGAADSQVDQVVQRVYLHVDERGTTAAAATGVAIVSSAGRATPPAALRSPVPVPGT